MESTDIFQYKFYISSISSELTYNVFINHILWRNFSDSILRFLRFDSKKVNKTLK